jgi:hypothetical protein
MTDRIYDVAISFLHRDEPLALELEAKLSANLKVFVYSKQQDQLAGGDGMESFREVFRDQSRLNVVLFRSGWGETRFTRVELAAIKDRCFNEGWDSLLFVMLDSNDKPPAWVPEENIRLDFSLYGFDQLIGAIKVRLEKLGGKLRKEDALTRAKRAEADIAARTQRDLILAQQGASSAQQERDALIRLLQEHVATLNREAPRIGIKLGCDSGHMCTMATSAASLNFYLHVNAPSKSRLIVREWSVVFRVPPEPQGVFLRNPTPVAEHEVQFDYQASRGGWCWRLEDKTLLTTSELADHILKLMIDLHERIEKKRSNPDYDPLEDSDDENPDDLRWK